MRTDALLADRDHHTVRRLGRLDESAIANDDFAAVRAVDEIARNSVVAVVEHRVRHNRGARTALEAVPPDGMIRDAVAELEPFHRADVDVVRKTVARSILRENASVNRDLAPVERAGEDSVLVAAKRALPDGQVAVCIQSYAGAVPVLALRAGKRHAFDDGVRPADYPDALPHADFPGRVDDGCVTARAAYDKVVRTPRTYVARVPSGRYLDDIAVACRPRGFRWKSIGAPRPHFKSRRRRGDAHEKQERGDRRLEHLPKIPQSRLEVGEPAVELRLIELGKGLAHRGAGLHALRDQVTPPHYRLRGGILYFKPLRLLRKPLERLWLRRERRPAGVVCRGDAQEAVDADDFRGETPYRAIRRLVMPHGVWPHVQPHERRDFL